MDIEALLKLLNENRVTVDNAPVTEATIGAALAGLMTSLGQAQQQNQELRKLLKSLL